MLALGVLCTGIAYILYFRLLIRLGPARAVTVTYLVPLGQYRGAEPARWIEERWALEHPHMPAFADVLATGQVPNSGVDIDLPIIVGGVEFGTIELGLSTLAVEQEIARALYWNLFIAVIGMSLVVLIVGPATLLPALAPR